MSTSKFIKPTLILIDILYLWPGSLYETDGTNFKSENLYELVGNFFM